MAQCGQLFICQRFGIARNRAVFRSGQLGRIGIKADIGCFRVKQTDHLLTGVFSISIQHPKHWIRLRRQIQRRHFRHQIHHRGNLRFVGIHGSQRIIRQGKGWQNADNVVSLQAFRRNRQEKPWGERKIIIQEDFVQCLNRIGGHDPVNIRHYSAEPFLSQSFIVRCLVPEDPQGQHTRSIEGFVMDQFCHRRPEPR